MKKNAFIFFCILLLLPGFVFANPLLVSTDLRTGLEQDNRVLCYNEKAYIIERAGQWASGDCTVTVVPLGDLGGTPEASYLIPPTGSNVYDIEFYSTSRAYVSRYGNKEILIIDPTDGSTLGTIDLAPYCGDWASPSYMYMAQKWVNYMLVESRLFVAIQDDWGTPGKVVVFDAMDNDSHLATINMVLYNPNADIDYLEGKIYVSCAGTYDYTSFCGIESIDILAQDGGGNYTYPNSVVATGGMLESATSVHDIEIINRETAFAVVANSWGSMQNIVKFDPVSGTLLQTLYEDFTADFTQEIKAYMPGYLFIGRTDKDASTGTDIPVYDFRSDEWIASFPSAGSQEVISITEQKDKVVLLTSNFNWQNPEGCLTSIELGNAPVYTGAVEVIDFSPGTGYGYGEPANVLGVHDGSLCTLGDGGSITLGFAEAVITDGQGADFSVFENAFWHNYPPGFHSGYFCEMAFVEVSTDGVNFAKFPTRALNNDPVSSYGTVNPLKYFGMAGNTLGQVGVHFDLSDLANDPLVLNGAVDLDSIVYVRISDIIGDGSILDSFLNPIYDPYPLYGDTCGFDLDAVEVVNHAYCLHLGIDENGNDVFPQELSEEDYYTGAASALMTLRFLDPAYALDQDYLYSTYHTGAPGEDMNAADVKDILQVETNNIPGLEAYNFGAIADPDEDHAIKKLIYWMDYEVSNVPEPNVPVQAPTDGAYSNNWKTVRGFVTSEDPFVNWSMPDFTVYGLWLSDPKAAGLGFNVYVTGDEFKAMYDPIDGNYMYVAEPPDGIDLDRLDARIDDVEVSYFVGKSDRMIAKVLNRQNNLFYRPLMHKAMKRLICSEIKDYRDVKWKSLIPRELKASAEFMEIFSTTSFNGVLKVEDLASGTDYGLVLFSQTGTWNTASVAMAVDEESGAFRMASWVNEDQKVLSLSVEEAVKIVKDVLGPFYHWRVRLVRNVEFEGSYFKPMYEITTGKRVAYVSQEGQCYIPE